MQIVIDIDENVYTRLFDNGGDDESDIAKVCAAVRGGTPLPEQHGKLIDADAVITKAIEDKEYEALELAIKALEQQPILDKIRAELEEKYGNYDICEWFNDYDYEENDISEYRPIGNIADVLEIIDKYRKEAET